MKIDFEFDTPYGVFRDALHLADDHGLSDSELAALKQQRLDSWLAIVNAPPAEITEQPVAVSSSIEIGGETYQLLEGTPPSSAKLIEVNGSWYYKV